MVAKCCESVPKNFRRRSRVAKQSWHKSKNSGDPDKQGRSADPKFSLSDVHALKANTDMSCIREGGYRDRRNYKKWEWSALAWLRNMMSEQLLFESSRESVWIWPAMNGYSLHLNNTDVYYNLTHAEVLGDTFNPKCVLNQMRWLKTTEKEDRPSIFREHTLNRQQSIMLHATKMMVGGSRVRR